jgi:integrase
MSFAVTRRRFEAAAAEAGIEGVTFHDLRHAYVSMLVARRMVPSTAIAKLVGHERVRSRSGSTCTCTTDYVPTRRYGRRWLGKPDAPHTPPRRRRNAR